ncbi:MULTISPECIES: RNA polymerase sigma factor [unclassified Leucobacter]|uniref:RNA polymerase sigma factor n=1 Tax=unclassified Leucobacter TaxID=2621730 RepID=UPI00165E3A1C|nr:MULTISPECIES: sigma-70 family RNA polymerase sigma factor [unclassified Leucobacter]MBC9935786.1 sigma-70 family RNA polymerase sigma factor [Leucobacter sp. cx-87]
MQQTQERSDEELCDLARSGESWPIGELWKRHAPVALAWAKKKDPVNGEDAVADAFDSVFHALVGGGGPETSFRGYLFRTVHTQLIRRWEKQHRSTSLDEFEFEFPDLGQPSSIEHLSNGEQQLAAARALSELPPRWREAIEAVDVKGTRVKDFAEQNGMSQNAATVLLKRAREGLRRSWLGQMHPSRDLPEECADTVSLFSEMRWGRRNGQQRKEAEAHTATCPNCGWRWSQFMSQASLVGLASAGMIGLFQGWNRRFAKPAVATAASVALAFALGTSLGPAFSGQSAAPAAPPVESLPAPAPAPEPTTTANPVVQVEPSVTPPPPSVDPAPVQTETPAQPEAPASEVVAPPEPTPPGEVLFGDWSDWCESTQSFTLDCPA